MRGGGNVFATVVGQFLVGLTLSRAGSASGSTSTTAVINYCESVTIGSNVFGGVYDKLPRFRDGKPTWGHEAGSFTLFYDSYSSRRSLRSLLQEDKRDLPALPKREDGEVEVAKTPGGALSYCDTAGWIVASVNDDGTFYPFYYVYDCAEDPSQIDASNTWYTCEDPSCSSSGGEISGVDMECTGFAETPAPAPVAITTAPVATTASPAETVAVPFCETLKVEGELFGGVYRIVDDVFNDNKPIWSDESKTFNLFFDIYSRRRRRSRSLRNMQEYATDLPSIVRPTKATGQLLPMAYCSTGGWVVATVGTEGYFPYYYVYDCAMDPSLITPSNIWYSCLDSTCLGAEGEVTAPTFECVDSSSLPSNSTTDSFTIEPTPAATTLAPVAATVVSTPVPSPTGVGATNASSSSNCDELSIVSKDFGGTYTIAPDKVNDNKPIWDDETGSMTLFFDIYSRRRSLQEGKASGDMPNIPAPPSGSKTSVKEFCNTGGWVVATLGATGNYPYYYVYDCAEDPSLISPSSVWYSCLDSSCIGGEGEVTSPVIDCMMGSDSSSSSSSITPAPVTPPTAAPVAETAVITDAPVAAATPAPVVPAMELITVTSAPVAGDVSIAEASTSASAGLVGGVGGGVAGVLAVGVLMFFLVRKSKQRGQEGRGGDGQGA